MVWMTPWACAERSPKLALRPSESGTLLNTRRAASSPLANVHRTITGVFPLEADPRRRAGLQSETGLVLWPIFDSSPITGTRARGPRLSLVLSRQSHKNFR